jgi:hypothetical protein
MKDRRISTFGINVDTTHGPSPLNVLLLIFQNRTGAGADLEMALFRLWSGNSGTDSTLLGLQKFRLEGKTLCQEVLAFAGSCNGVWGLSPSIIPPFAFV